MATRRIAAAGFILAVLAPVLAIGQVKAPALPEPFGGAPIVIPSSAVVRVEAGVSAPLAPPGWLPPLPGGTSRFPGALSAAVPALASAAPGAPAAYRVRYDPACDCHH